MKKAVITILGLIGHQKKYQEIEDEIELMEEITSNYKKYCFEEDILKFQKKLLNRVR